MKLNILFFIPFLVFLGCSNQPPVTMKDMPKTELLKSNFEELPNWENEEYDAALNHFMQSCKTTKTKNIYKELCQKAEEATDSKEFLMDYFVPYKIVSSNNQEGLLTGYYEPELKGSMIKKEPYIYPVYETPNDLITVDLSNQYPELKNYRLRGRIKGNKLVPYYEREEADEKSLDADIICYTDSKIDLFFLEVQGSGRVRLENGETIFIGYDNQNGHRYKSIGKYLVNKDEIPLEEISLQSIKAWLENNPSRVDEVLNYNKSMVFFKQKEQPASGSLGVVLTPRRSVAVDRRYIPLGSMLYLSARTKNKVFNHVVMAQDTGGAIKGSIRADLFCGYGEEAKEIAGELKAPLTLWIFLPKEES